MLYFHNFCIPVATLKNFGTLASLLLPTRGSIYWGEGVVVGGGKDSPQTPLPPKIVNELLIPEPRVCGMHK